MAVKWPGGFSGAGVAAGIKGTGELDVALLVAEREAQWAGAFTSNAAAAAPVRWSRDRIGRKVRAVVVNSGNANACTGSAGEGTVKATVEAASGLLGCAPDDVLVASTGPIGMTLDPQLLRAGLPLAARSLTPDVGPFARAILTTDTRTKIATRFIGEARVVGVAKGAAMLAPNMATMLAFITTDAVVEGSVLEESVRAAVDTSFNRICVDGCESTNDSVFVLASGVAGEVDESDVATALSAICGDLASQIVSDAEGSTRAVRIRVTDARSDQEAAVVGRAIASSALWRAAVHGADPNWGRILAAAGAVDRELDLGKVDLAIGAELMFSSGEPVGSLEAAAKVMDADEFEVVCSLGRGTASAEVMTVDLTPDYVELNAHGTS
jgi:glutamate N-acetyltransferase/amino-acid N-acetyltransferase